MTSNAIALREQHGELLQELEQLASGSGLSALTVLMEDVVADRLVKALEAGGKALKKVRVMSNRGWVVWRGGSSASRL